MSANIMIISCVLGTLNRLEYLKLTIQTLRQEVNELDHEIIVIDGGSNDGTLEWLIEQKDIITIVQHNYGEFNGRPIMRRSWGYFMNLGFKIAQGKYICMLSDDCLVVPSAIKNGLSVFEHELSNRRKIGAVAFYWRDWPAQQDYWVGYTLGDKLFVNHGLYLKEAFEKIGFMDEYYYSFYHADGDWCLRLWNEGYECIESPESYIEHYCHANLAIRNLNNEKQQEDWKKYLQRWQGIYYLPEENNTGSWKYKTFKDSYGTIKLFKPLYNSYLNQLKKRYMSNKTNQAFYNKNKKVYVWGTGNLYKMIKDEFDFEVHGFVDNNRKNDFFEGKPVISPEQLKFLKKDEINVLIASSFYQEIALQLNQMGFESEIHYWNVVELYNSVIEYKLALQNLDKIENEVVV